MRSSAAQLSCRVPRRSQQYSSTASAANSIVRSSDSHGRTVSSACSSLTPASKASSPRKPAAIRSASRRCSPELREGLQQELLVGYRLADLERGVPRGEHRQVVVVEHLDGLGVVHLQLVVGDLVDPRAHDLAEQLAPCLAADGVRHDANGFLGLYEAQGHGRQATGRSRRKGRSRGARHGLAPRACAPHPSCRGQRAPGSRGTGPGGAGRVGSKRPSVMPAASSLSRSSSSSRIGRRELLGHGVIGALEEHVGDLHPLRPRPQGCQRVDDPLGGVLRLGQLGRIAVRPDGRSCSR